MNEPITFGVPFPKGIVFEPSRLSLWNNKCAQVPLQAQSLTHWFDGSAKWVLFDFTADVLANAQTVYAIRPSDHHALEVPCRIAIQESPHQLIVDTEKAVFYLNRRLCKPFDRIIVGGTELLMPEGSCFALTDDQGEVYLPQIENLSIKTKGLLRTTLHAHGEMRSVSGKKLARFLTRLNFYAGSSLVEIQNTLHNPRAARHPGGLWDLGDEGSIFFKDLSLRVPMLSAGSTPRVCWSANTSLYLKEASADVEVYQDSSGGENWHSTNHVNRFGEVKQSFRGYRVKERDSLVEEGLRATPIVGLTTDSGTVVGTLKKFWQNFPKAIESHSNELVIRLFPKQFGDVFELQGGEQKTHTIYVQFSRSGETAADLNWVHNRLLPRATPELYADTNACPYLSPLSQDPNVEYQALIDVAIAGPQSFFARREIIDEYGWRHFGDLYADHEAVGHTGRTPLVAHYNNQYDVIYGAFVQYIRSGNERWFELMDDLAKHVIDIDIYHTDEDRPAYNGGLFWHTDHYLDAGTATHRSFSKAALATKNATRYGGGPANEHNYTTGLLHYYYLTGDVKARQAVISLADWVLNMDDGSQRVLGWLDKRPTGFCSASARRDYHGPGRGAGNSLNALIDAFSLTHNPAYLKKVDEIIRRCIHPHDDFNARELENIEHHWSYLVFLQALGKYLDIKIAKDEIDYMYSYARASLVHYAEWMLRHEVPYATVLHRVEIPTETWPAQDIRKTAIFHLAARYVDGALREAFENRASFFFNSCITDLRTFATCTLTRPLALLMSNAHVHSYFMRHHYTAPLPREVFNYGEPAQFSPQFAESYWVREKLVKLLRLVTKSGTGLKALILNRPCASEMHDA